MQSRQGPPHVINVPHVHPRHSSASLCARVHCPPPPPARLWGDRSRGLRVSEPQHVRGPAYPACPASCCQPLRRLPSARPHGRLPKGRCETWTAEKAGARLVGFASRPADHKRLVAWNAKLASVSRITLHIRVLFGAPPERALK